MEDLIIIGGGPAGLKLASLVGKRINTTILEEHYEIGKPSHCTGLFSKPVFEMAPYKAVTNKVRGAILKLGTMEFSISKNETVAYVVERSDFDKSLAAEAINNNVKVQLGARVRDILTDKNGTKVIYRKDGEIRELESSVVVGADGSGSVVRKKMGQSIPSYLGAMQLRVSGAEIDEDYVKLLMGSDIAPGFFGWIVPEGDSMAKVGVAIGHGNAVSYIKKILKDDTLKNARILGLEGGVIPVGMVQKKVLGNLLLVGDAAGFVKATSGGGVYMGLKSSINAAKVILDNLEGRSYGLDNYEKLISKLVKELKMDLRIHNIYSTFSDAELKDIFTILSRKENVEIIEKYGDIDYPSKVAFALLKRNLTLLKYGSKLLKN
ncbi:MAG: geranylgeranyl reductase family protein [Thermoplasmata archaeon]